MIARYSGTHAVVVGLAREGVSLAGFLAERGARVTATDLRSAEALADSLSLLAGQAVDTVLGEHPAGLLDRADIVFVSPGVPAEIPFLHDARQRGLPLSSETRLFTRLCRAPVIGITGSSGKTTTTAMVGQMLKTAGRKTWVGGNIGQPLTPHLDAIAPDDIVVMELSSFQLEYFGQWSPRVSDTERSTGHRVLFDPSGWSPRFAGLLNITPNHLDRHHTMEAYTAAKVQILAHQTPQDTAILNWDDPVTRGLAGTAASDRRVVWFSMAYEVSEGTFLRQEALVTRLAGREHAICHADQLRLLGRHNVANALAACALAGAAGAPTEAIRETAMTFRGVEHRLELVREQRGVRWYNDSIATSPERTVAALRAFSGEEVTLLAGGRDKHLPWQEMAALTWQLARHMILFGEAAPAIERAMRESPFSSTQTCEVHLAESLEDAVQLAAKITGSGGVVLLSPGGTSFDAYQDFVARGEHFRSLVEALE
jgi:UDP-N-acetylmuramoylalanine--D-glutamate ligase